MNAKLEVKRYLKILDPVRQAALDYASQPHRWQNQYQMSFREQIAYDVTEMLLRRHCSRCGKALICAVSFSRNAMIKSTDCRQFVGEHLYSALERLFNTGCNCSMIWGEE